MPVNAAPKQPPFGDVLIVYRAATNQLIAEKARGQNTQGRKLYESHWATCPGELATRIRKSKPPQGSARRAG
jgi:hypothetical protein